MEALAKFSCPNCGPTILNDAKRIVLFYPKALGKPFARVHCEVCDQVIMAAMEWSDAVNFDRAGCVVDGFSFVRAEPLTEEEISGWVEDKFEGEMIEFLDAAYSGQ